MLITYNKVDYSTVKIPITSLFSAFPALFRPHLSLRLYQLSPALLYAVYALRSAHQFRFPSGPACNTARGFALKAAERRAFPEWKVGIVAAVAELCLVKPRNL